VKHADSGVLRDLPTDELHAHRCAAWCRRYAKNVVAMRMKGHSSSRFSDADGGGAVDAPARHRPALTSARRTDALYARRFRTYDAGIVSPETVSDLLYRTTASAPWLVREAGPPAPRPPRLLERVREAIR
jgi:hypothetical protein